MKTVYVGMSGGVDSSVAAALLCDQGYRLVGVYMKNWTAPVGGVRCPWESDLNDARAVAAKLGITFKVFDFQEQYRSKVVDYLVAEYQAGRTPNPDVMCNQEIKFKLFLSTALADGADLIATGHYARIEDGHLLTGIDLAKDQSYFLYRIGRQALSKSLMPIGHYTKPRVRELAADRGLATATKPDSQGICFVGEVGIKDFLRRYLRPRPGSIMTTDGRSIGNHDGVEFFTIGQRHGLGVGGGRPYFVTGKDMETATVWVTDEADDMRLNSDRIMLESVHWLGQGPVANRVYQIRTRYRGPLISARLAFIDGVWQANLEQPDRAVTSGQSAVIYDGDVVVGGGIIASTSIKQSSKSLPSLSKKS